MPIPNANTAENEWENGRSQSFITATLSSKYVEYNIYKMPKINTKKNQELLHA